jgi:hypothetical protein
MKKCKECPDKTSDCPTGPDGALLALGPIWGGADRDCPKELADWSKEAEAVVRKKPGPALPKKRKPAG